MARIARILTTVTREASLRADAMTDPMTGLANYRSFSQSLERELERSRRYAMPLSLITVDLDHLKVINDEHGHDAGNDAIRLAARVLTGAVRKFEVVARIGGDEFAVILPSTGASDARRLAERLRAEIRAQVVHGVRLSASVGVASWSDRSVDAAALSRPATRLFIAQSARDAIASRLRRQCTSAGAALAPALPRSPPGASLPRGNGNPWTQVCRSAWSPRSEGPFQEHFHYCLPVGLCCSPARSRSAAWTSSS